MARLKKQQLDTARTWMEKHGIDPVDQLCREVTLSLKLSDEQAAHPSIAAMVGGNYELIPAVDGNGWTLRLAVHRRIEVFKALSEFVYPKLRSTEAKIETDQQITWCIQTWSTDADGKPVCTKSPLQNASTLRRGGEPLKLRNGEPERELHPGDHESVS